MLPKFCFMKAFEPMKSLPVADPVVACGIDSSFPALLHFAYRYAEAGPRIALLASADQDLV